MEKTKNDTTIETLREILNLDEFYIFAVGKKKIDSPKAIDIKCISMGKMDRYEAVGRLFEEIQYLYKKV